MFNDLTIVIPTRNRKEYVGRQLSYILNWNTQIFLLDGSDKINSYLKDVAEKYAHINYIYSTDGFEKRISFLKNNIKTKYTMFMADDEFFVKKSIGSCIEFLENNIDYTSCSGIAVGFIKSQENKIIYKKMYARLIGYEISDKDPKERVIKHMSEYVPSSVYGVLRTSVINKFISEINYSFTSSPETTENWLQNTVAYMGKIKVLPILYWFRSMENSPVQDKNWNRTTKIYQWYNQKKFKKEKMEYIKKFCELNSENSHSFFELALSNLSKDLHQRGQGTFKLAIKLFFKRGINLFLRKLKLYKIHVKRNESTFFDYEVLKNFLNENKITYDSESIKQIEKKILQK